MEKYDPYVSAELQMLELLSGDNGSPKNGEKVPSSTSHHSSTNSLNNNSNPRTTPTSIRSSPSSAFAKFFPVSPETLPQSHPVSPDSTVIENKENNNDYNSDGQLSPPISDKSDNRRNISLSNLSLCSVISLDSVDCNRNPVSAKLYRPKPEDLRRSNSAIEPVKPYRHANKPKLNMHQMLYGTSVVPVSGNDEKTKEDLEACEAELLISMLEFEKMLNDSPTPPPDTSPTLCSSSTIPNQSNTSLRGIHLDDEQDLKMFSNNTQSGDSAYSRYSYY
jgi:hypothetical protein